MSSQVIDDNDNGPVQRLPQHLLLQHLQDKEEGEKIIALPAFPLKTSSSSNDNHLLHLPRRSQKQPHRRLMQQQRQQVLPPPLQANNNEAHNYYFYTPAPTTISYNNYNNEAAATGVWRYMSIVFGLLVLWVFSLMLPKAARKQFFGSMPRRYNRRRYTPSEAAELSTLADDSVDDSILKQVEQRRITSSSSPFRSTSNISNGNSHNISTLNSSYISEAGSETGSVFMRPLPKSSSKYNSTTRAAMAHQQQQQQQHQQQQLLNTSNFSSSQNSQNSSYLSAMRSYPPGTGLPPPSPGHPAISRLPSAKILNETMKRLKTRGIRLVAHGVASESKRVWIRFEEDTTSLSWQTEFPRKVPNQLGEVSLVMMRGALHRIALPNILYVDVGKKTNALKKPENDSVPDQVCFSLLTQNGSLDLQANSRLERDALVSTFSIILDGVHSQDWRSLYAETPESSTVQSACMGSADLSAVEF